MNLFHIKSSLNQHGCYSFKQLHYVPFILFLIGPFQRTIINLNTLPENDGVLLDDLVQQSPDLNPIQMVFNEMDCEMNSKLPSKCSVFLVLRQDCRKIICDDNILKLLHKIRRKCTGSNQRKGQLFGII